MSANKRPASPSGPNDRPQPRRPFGDEAPGSSLTREGHLPWMSPAGLHMHRHTASGSPLTLRPLQNLQSPDTFQVPGIQDVASGNLRGGNHPAPASAESNVATKAHVAAPSLTITALEESDANGETLYGYMSDGVKHIHSDFQGSGYFELFHFCPRCLDQKGKYLRLDSTDLAKEHLKKHHLPDCPSSTQHHRYWKGLVTKKLCPVLCPKGYFPTQREKGKIPCQMVAHSFWITCRCGISEEPPTFEAGWDGPKRTHITVAWRQERSEFLKVHKEHKELSAAPFRSFLPGGAEGGGPSQIQASLATSTRSATARHRLERLERCVPVARKAGNTQVAWK